MRKSEDYGFDRLDVKDVQDGNYSKALSNALNLLEIFRTDEELNEFGVTELSEMLGLHKNNIFRILSTLRDNGFIEQNKDTENYSLGVKILNIGQIYIHNLNILKSAKKYAREVVTLTDESVYIGVLNRSQIVYLDVTMTSNPIRVVSRLGKTPPSYATSTGKILLSELSNDEVHRMFHKVKFTPYTDNTITSIDELINELEIIREQGYAIDNEELEEGVYCIAVPIKDYHSRSVASFTIIAPSFRVNDDSLASVLPLMQDRAHQISKALGYSGS